MHETAALKIMESPFDDDEEDIIELSLRRAKEMDEHPETVISEDEFWASLEEYRRR